MGPLQAVLAKPLTLCAAATSFWAGWSDPLREGPGEPRRAVERTPPLVAEGRGGGQKTRGYLWLTPTISPSCMSNCFSVKCQLAGRRRSRSACWSRAACTGV